MKLPVIVTALALACAPVAAEKPAAAKATKTFLAQKDIVEKMNALYPDVTVDVRWEPCGTLNSFYYFNAQKIILCTEFEAYPGAAVFVAAHEMAHAIQHQLTDVTSEQDADELAALAMVKFGYTDELLDAAMFWKQRSYQGRTGEEHPAAGFRAWELACIAAGSEGAPNMCVALYYGLVVRWSERLKSDWTTFPED